MYLRNHVKRLKTNISKQNSAPSQMSRSLRNSVPIRPRTDRQNLSGSLWRFFLQHHDSSLSSQMRGGAQWQSSDNQSTCSQHQISLKSWKRHILWDTTQPRDHANILLLLHILLHVYRRVEGHLEVWDGNETIPDYSSRALIDCTHVEASFRLYRGACSTIEDIETNFGVQISWRHWVTNM